MPNFEKFFNILIQLRKHLPSHSITLEGGGAAPLCIGVVVQHPNHNVTNDGKWTMWFGQANETWGADVYVDLTTCDTFDEFDTNTFVASDCPFANVVALAIANVVTLFEATAVTTTKISKGIPNRG